MLNDDQPKRLVVGGPNLGNFTKFQELVAEAFERRWFTNHGQIAQRLEAILAEYLEVKHCVLVCNATIGLQVAAHELGLSGEVLVPAFTFVASPHSLLWQKITPRFVDVDPLTHLMDPKLLEAAITEKTTGILGVHLWGQACYSEQLQAIADRHGLKLYFDSAHAFGCSHQGKMLGSFGDCEVFSFHATKFFNSFEGGALTTNDDLLAQKIRRSINFGFIGLDSVAQLGTNGKMSEIHAAMGIACFESLDEIIAVNYEHYLHYRKRLATLKGIRFLEYSDLEKTNYQYVVMEIDSSLAGISRDQIIEHLHSKNIFARRYFYPGCHRMAPYVNDEFCMNQQMPKTDLLCQQVIVLPTGTSMSADDVMRVCDEIEALCL
jgi:dTDP-4-amino-4,6-dideoxygalactose transaminase